MSSKKPMIDDAGEVRELTAEDMAEFKPAEEVLPSELLSVLPKRGRGKQRAPTKRQITLRISPDIVEYFKSEGKGWQTKMEQAMREYMDTHPHV